MVIAVAYTLVFELIISFIPAIINTFTVQYRIRTLLLLWGEMKIAPRNEYSFWRLSAIHRPGSTSWCWWPTRSSCWSAAIGVVRSREFSAAEEGEALERLTVPAPAKQLARVRACPNSPHRKCGSGCRAG